MRSFIWVVTLSALVGSGVSATVPAQAASADIVAIAEAELRNTERNHEEPLGSDCNFYVAQTRPHMGACGNGWRAGSWCADFAKYVWRLAGISEATRADRATNLNGWAHSFYEYGLRHGTWHSRESGYRPRPGDAILFDWAADGFDPTVGSFTSGGYDIDHVGIVRSSDGTTVSTIEGNADDRVKARSYALADRAVVGYSSPAAVDWPILVRGARGAEVTALQYLLLHSGRQVSVDGDFGRGTEAAVRDFQAVRGLSVDGSVGPQTWSALATTVRHGNNNNAVKAVQFLLNAKRDAGLVVDGDFGGRTKSAVLAFQDLVGIDMDAVVGPVTWRHLVAYRR